MYFPNSLIVVPNVQPIYVGQAFNLLVGYIDNDGNLFPLTLSDFTYRIFNNINSNLVDNNFVFTARASSSYTIIFNYEPITSAPLTFIFNFYAATPVNIMNESKLYTILKQELPNSYNNNVDTSSGNYLDNIASVKVLNDMYALLYRIINEQYPSNGYTTNWEYALNGTNNLFQQAKYPAQIITLLYRVPYNTGITRYDLTLFIAKYCYYFTGSPVVVYISINNIITIYSGDDVSEWILGDPVNSILGVTTILGTIEADLFAYLLLLFVLRLFPIQIYFTLIFSSSNPLDILSNVGYTYMGDIRDIVGMSYLGDDLSPFNIEGYTLI